MILRKATLGILALCLMHLWSARLQAQFVEVAGVQFKVDALSQIDDKAVKLTIFGQTRIIAKTDLQRVVLEQYGAAPQNLAFLSTDRLLGLCSDLIGEGRGAMAALLTPELTLRREAGEKLAAQVSAALASEHADGAVEFCKRSLDTPELSRKAAELTGICLLEISLNDSDWIRSNQSALLYRSMAAVLDRAQARLRDSLSHADFTAGAVLIAALERVYGSANQRIAVLRLALSRAQELAELAKQGVSERFMPLLEISFTDPSLRPLLDQFSLQLAHAQVQRLQILGEAARSVRLLSMIPLNLRTPQTHQLALQALGSLEDEQIDVLIDPAVRRFMLVLCRADHAIQNKVLEVLSGRIEQLIGMGQAGASDRHLQIILALRPDPDKQNDEIRVEQALALLGMGSMPEFEAKLAEIRTGLNLRLKTRFLVYRIRNSKSVRSIILILAMLGIALIIKRIVQKHATTLAQLGQQAFSPEPEGMSDEEKVRFSAMRVSLSPRRNEYSDCLSMLGLQAGASLREIKSAYRNLVKEVHPDTRPADDRQAQDRFIELTSIYDRILELREELGITDGAA